MRSAASLVLLAVLAVALVACDPARPDYTDEVKRMTGGDPHAGRDAIRRYGCHACHTIPGITGADALVGPPLIHWSRRMYIAGQLPNTPQNLTQFMQHPPQVAGRTAMPDMGVTEQDSRDIAAYLYTLK